LEKGNLAGKNLLCKDGFSFLEFLENLQKISMEFSSFIGKSWDYYTMRNLNYFLLGISFVKKKYYYTSKIEVLTKVDM
jgi:hypothetical protein